MANQINIRVEDLNLRPIGKDTDAAPESVLKGTIQIGTGEFHVFAYQVTADSGGILHTVNTAYADDLEHVYGLNGDSLTSISINGLDYVLTVYPFSN